MDTLSERKARGPRERALARELNESAEKLSELCAEAARLGLKVDIHGDQTMQEGADPYTRFSVDVWSPLT